MLVINFCHKDESVNCDEVQQRLHTVLLSLSISSANCERNLLPTLINDNFPGARAAVLFMMVDLAGSSVSKIRRSRSLLLRSTRLSNDECSASLFFSMN